MPDTALGEENRQSSKSDGACIGVKRHKKWNMCTYYVAHTQKESKLKRLAVKREARDVG